MPQSRKKVSKFARRPFQPGDKLNAIGSTLRRIRCARGWSQELLATRCQVHGWDIDRGMVAKLESHIRAVSDWELLKLCEVVGVSPNEFLGVEALPRDAGKLSAHLKSRKMKQGFVQ